MCIYICIVIINYMVKVMKGDMYRVFYGNILVKKYFGIKAGKSFWKEVYIKTRCYGDKNLAVGELIYLRDCVLPAAGCKILGYSLQSYLKVEEEF